MIFISSFVTQFLLVTLLISGNLVFAVEAERGPASYLICKSQKNVRTIRVVKENEECRTLYTKGGVDRIVGNGKNAQACYGVAKNIRNNLESGNWKCKDISESRVSDSLN